MTKRYLSENKKQMLFRDAYFPLIISYKIKKFFGNWLNFEYSAADVINFINSYIQSSTIPTYLSDFFPLS